MDFAKVDQIIEDNAEALIGDIATLVSFKSTEGNGGVDVAGGKPFGAEVRKALDAALSIADRLGFETRCGDGYYGIADFAGCGANASSLVAVLGHLDVVPANPADWDSDPFTLTINGDKLVGRGVIDDKGPLFASIYAAFALREAGFVPDKTLRFIMGTNEETNMAGVEEYKRREQHPECGFTPDSSWPVVMGEKGVYQFKIKKSWSFEATALPFLKSLEAGTATNIVPAKAEARFEVGDADTKAVADVLANAILSAGYSPDEIKFSIEGNEIVVASEGIASHGSVPQDGDNALSKLIRLLANVDFAPSGAKSFINQITRLTKDDKYGSELGLAGEDDYSNTTVCPTVIRMNSEGAELSFDMRFRLCDTCARYEKLLNELAAREDFKVEVIGKIEPLFADKNGKLIQSLLSAFREVTGDMTEPMVIGGATYAKHVKGLVAFGPEPIDEPTRAHIANEFIRRGELLDAAKIYARAIYSLTR